MYQKLKQKTKPHGSILAFSLIIMGIILVSAIGIAAVSVTEQKNSGATAKSTQSFQVANSASELLQQYRINNLTVSLDNPPAGWSCTGSGTWKSNNINGGSAEITFYEGTETTATQLNCDTSGKTLEDVQKIKVVGAYAGTARAIETAVASGSLNWQDATLESGWQSWKDAPEEDGHQDDYYDVQYAKDLTTGLVYLRGGVYKRSGSGDCIFYLDSAYWPTKNPHFPVATDSDTTYIYIDRTNGCIDPGIEPDEWLGLDGVVFATN